MTATISKTIAPTPTATPYQNRDDLAEVGEFVCSAMILSLHIPQPGWHHQTAT